MRRELIRRSPVTVRVRDSERTQLKRAAERQGESVSSFLRQVGLRAARRVLSTVREIGT